MNNRTITDLKKLYKSLQVKDGNECVYCGLVATDVEHVTPKSFLDRQRSAMIGMDAKPPKEILVMSCNECNLMASDKIFKSFAEKRDFIRKRILQKYKKFVKYEIWTDDEIRELSGNLREQVFLYNEIAKLTQRRFARLKHGDIPFIEI